MANESFECPSCQKEFPVPPSGPTYLKPLREKSETIQCTSCRCNLDIDANALRKLAGQTVDCPVCRGKTLIPGSPSKVNAFVKPARSHESLWINQPIITASTQPEGKPGLPSLPVCPSCNSEMPTNAVICTSCGLDLRTGQKIVTSSLQFKKKEGFESLPEYVTSRTGMSPDVTWQDIQRQQKLNKAYTTLINIFVYIFLPILAFFSVCYFLDLGRSESKSWNLAVTALSDLKIDQKNAEALQTIKRTIPTLENGLTGRIPKTGLMVVWTIGQINLGNTNLGLNACQRLEKKHSDSKFLPFLSLANFTATCKACNETDPSPVCQTCKGTGKVTFNQLDVPRLYEPETDRKIRRLGKNQGGNYSDERPLIRPCTTCKGTGKIAVSKCSKCAGKRWEIVPSMLQTHFNAVLKKIYPYVVIKYYFEKIVDVEIYLHARLSGKTAESSVLISSADENLLDNESDDLLTDKEEEEKRHDKLCREIATKFFPPKIGELITLKPDGGNPMTGVLVNITESGVEIRSKDGNAKITLQRIQLDAESRARCFKDDYADFHARKAITNGKLQ